MPRATLLLTSMMCFSLVALNFAQEGDSRNQQSETRSQQTDDDAARNRNAESDANQSQRSRQDQNRDQRKRGQNAQQSQQRGQVIEVGLEEGQTIAIPARGELLELTVAVPETVRSGQRYRYHARVRNVSQSTTLANVRLVQIDGDRVDIEDAQLRNQKQTQSSQNQQKQNQQNQNQQKQNQQKQNQQNQQKQNQQNQQKQQASQQQQSSEGGNTLWNLGRLNPGDSQVLSVTAIASDTGEADHCFAVKYQEVLCAKVEVVEPRVTITKAGPEQAGVCEVFEYRYELKNTGTGVAKDFIVRDELPEGLKTKSGKNEVAFRVPELKEGQTESYVAEVHSMKAGEYGSRAVVEQKSGETHQSKQVATRVIAPELDLQIEGPRAIKAGEGGNFDVTVTNTSDVTARNVILTLDPNENAEVTNAGNGDAREGGSHYRYELGDLEPQENKSVSISLNSQQEAKNLTLNARAASLCALGQDQKAVAVAEAEANMQARVMRITSLLLSLVDTDDVIPTGDSITYRLRVRNQGSFADKNVKVNLELPSGLKFKEGDGPSEVDANGQRVSLGAVDRIEPGETLEWQITASTESAGEKVVQGTLDSEGLSTTVESEEVSTIYDASRQEARGNQSDSSRNRNNRGNQSDSGQNENDTEE